jgi:small subunit ribosomal protein S17
MKTHQLTGTVIKKSSDKTISVQVNRVIRHPKYLKQMTRSKKYLVHDPENTAIIGQTVVIAPCRPISKQKSYALVTTDKGNS